MKKNQNGSANLSLILIILAIIVLACAAIIYFVGGGREKANSSGGGTGSYGTYAPSGKGKGGVYVAAEDVPESYDADPTSLEVTVKGDKITYNGTEYELNDAIAQLLKYSKPQVTVINDGADEEFLSTALTAMKSAGIRINMDEDTSEEDPAEEAASEDASEAVSEEKAE